MPNLDDVKTELAEGLDHKVSIYGFAPVLEALADLAAARAPFPKDPNSQFEVVGLELQGLAQQLRDAGEGEPAQ